MGAFFYFLLFGSVCLKIRYKIPAGRKQKIHITSNPFFLLLEFVGWESLIAIPGLILGETCFKPFWTTSEHYGHQFRGHLQRGPFYIDNPQTFSQLKHFRFDCGSFLRFQHHSSQPLGSLRWSVACLVWWLPCSCSPQLGSIQSWDHLFP